MPTGSKGISKAKFGEALREELREYPGDLYADAVEYVDNPILTNGLPGEFDDWGLHNPSPAYDEVADKVYIAYTGHKGSFSNCLGIGIAESDDGLNFTKLVENPVVTPPAGFDMVYNGSGSLYYDYRSKKWRMYLVLHNTATNAWDTIGVAQADSVHGPWTWVSTSVVNVPGARLADPSILRVGVGPYGYILSFLNVTPRQINIYGSNDGIVFAVLATGIGFAQYPDTSFNNSLGKTNFEANVLRLYNDWFLLFYEATNRGDHKYEFHVALGKSPLNLTHSSLVSLVIPNSLSDRCSPVHPAPLLTPKKFYLYYLIHDWQDMRTPYMNVAFLNKGLLEKLTANIAIYGYTQEPGVTRIDYPWKNRSIAAPWYTANFPVNLLDYDRKTLYFRTNTAGTLTIEADPAGDGGWGTYDTMVLGAGDLNVWKPYIITGNMPYLRVSFNLNAIVSCVLVAGRRS